MRALPFTVIQYRGAGGGSGRELARFECARCGAHDEFPLVRSGKTFNPEATCKRAEQGGWSVSPSRCECPHCLASSRARSKGESPGPKNVIQMEPYMADPKPVPREATPDEKRRTRALLDKHFDDGTGRYLDGYTDQRVATELNIPLAIVAEIRRVGYGDWNQEDPEVIALRSYLAALKSDLDATADKVEQARKRLEALAGKRAA